MNGTNLRNLATACALLSAPLSMGAPPDGPQGVISHSSGNRIGSVQKAQTRGPHTYVQTKPSFPTDRPPKSSEMGSVLAEFAIPKGSEQIILPVSLGGKEYKVLLDTGCGFSAYDKSLRNLLGAPIRKIKLQAMQEEYQGDLYEGPQGSVGSLQLDPKCEVLCDDFSTWRRNGKTDVFGVLGMDFLSRFIVRVDIDAGRIAFLRSSPAPAGVYLPLEYHLRIPFIKAYLSGQGYHLFMIDTGFNGTATISPQLVERATAIGLAEVTNTQRVMTASGVVSSPRSGQMNNALEVGCFKHSSFNFIEAECNALGACYLKQFVITFDFPGGEIGFSPNEKLCGAIRVHLAGTGLTLCHTKDGIYVLAVENDTESGQSRIMPNDRVLAIDGVAASDISGGDFLTLMGEFRRTKLRLRRGSNEREVTVVPGK